MAYKGSGGFRLNPIWALSAVNIALFIASVLNQDILFILGLSPANVLRSPWSVVTSLFIHASLWHLIVNMWAFYFFGTYLSRLVGGGRFLIVYFCGGMLGSLFFVLLASPFSIAVGASGAIFALGGALAVMRPRLKVFVFPIPVPVPLWTAVIGGFFIISLFSIFLPIAWQAHLGGLVLGLIAGYFFRRREHRLYQESIDRMYRY